YFISRAMPVSGPDHIVISTETGFCTKDPPGPNSWWVSERIADKYTSRAYFEAFIRGIPKTFLYELLDQDLDVPTVSAENHFGLLRYDFSYKPAANTLKNLIALLQDPNATFTPDSLDYTITGANADLRHTLLQKSDGSFYLALWQDSYSFDVDTGLEGEIAPLPIDIAFATSVPYATVYFPVVSQFPISNYTSVSHINLVVSDEVVLVRLGSTLPPPLMNLT